jgi:hypothetical protein
MKSIEDKIWDTITNSAKGKFDYDSFRENFLIDPDMVIFMIILGFASGKSKEMIKMELFNQMLMTGFKWKVEDIADFINDKEELFKLEINLSKTSKNMLDAGNEPLIVYNLISQLL